MSEREDKEKSEKNEKKEEFRWQMAAVCDFLISRLHKNLCGRNTQTICLTESLNVSDSSIPRFFAPFIARLAQLLGDDSFARCRFNSLFVTRAFLSFPSFLSSLEGFYVEISVFRSRAIRDVCERKKRFASEVIREECVFVRECFATTREKHRKGYGLRSVPKLLLSKS